MGRRPKKDMADIKQRFARAYVSATSPTRGKQAASVRSILPDISDEAAKKMGHRLANDPEVEEIIQKIYQASATLEAISNEDYVNHCMAQEKFLLNRGARGDVNAAVKYAELAGKASGRFIIQHKDLTPPENKRGFLSSAERKEELVEAMRLYAELDKPNPMPQIGKGTVDPPVSEPAGEDFIIVEETHETLEITVGEDGVGIADRDADRDSSVRAGDGDGIHTDSLHRIDGGIRDMGSEPALDIPNSNE